MPYKLPKAALDAALQHLVHYGDTDVFPHLFELSFFADKKDDLTVILEGIDLDTYQPAGALEAIAPKSRLSFRVVHQLSALDTVLLLACVTELGPKIEAFRAPIDDSRAFSYRFSPGERGQLFRRDRTYKDWLQYQHALVSFDRHIRFVVSTDISDFYARINFHRLENLLDEVAPNHGAAKYVKRHIKTIRARQSFGLPVGGSASRLLAELALADTDVALRNYGINCTRFVDDFRLFLTEEHDPYDALGYLAQHLGVSEGLSLNASKTKLYTRAEFSTHIKSLTTDIEDEVEGIALEALTASVYFDENPDPVEVERLKGINLLALLQHELDAEHIDIARIKIIFRALRFATPSDAIEYISFNFSELTVFAKDITLLMAALDTENPGCFSPLTSVVIEAILSKRASNVHVIRAWLLEILVRGIVPVTIQQMRALDSLHTPLDKRQIALIRGRIRDTSYFRLQKTQFSSVSIYEQACVVAGASCLPRDEYENWLRFLEPNFSQPGGKLLLKWALQKREHLIPGNRPQEVDDDE